MICPFLIGETIYLRLLTEEDCKGNYPSWLNDPEVCAGNRHHVYPYDASQALEYIRGIRGDKTCLVLAICLQENKAHVGNISLSAIHPVYRSGDLSILIGDRSAWNRGVGREAAGLLIEHGFGTLNLNRISCGTFESNEGMIKLAQSLNMKQEGRLRQAAFKNNQYLDVLLFSILREEYE